MCVQRLSGDLVAWLQSIVVLLVRFKQRLATMGPRAKLLSPTLPPPCFIHTNTHPAATPLGNSWLWTGSFYVHGNLTSRYAGGG